MAASGERLRRPDRLVVTIPTNDGLTIALVMFPIAEFGAVKSDIESSLHGKQTERPQIRSGG